MDSEKTYTARSDSAVFAKHGPKVSLLALHRTRMRLLQITINRLCKPFRNLVTQCGDAGFQFLMCLVGEFWNEKGIATNVSGHLVI